MMAMTMVGMSRDWSDGDSDLFSVAVSVFLGGREEAHFVFVFVFVFVLCLCLLFCAWKFEV